MFGRLCWSGAAMLFITGASLFGAACGIDPLELSGKSCDDEHPCAADYDCVREAGERQGECVLKEREEEDDGESEE